jgi:hypothetical protein
MKRILTLAALIGALSLASCGDKAPSGSGAGPEDISRDNATGNNPSSTEKPSDVPAGSQDTLNGGQ